MRVIPAVQAARGDTGEADYDIQFSKGLISDALHSGDGELGEAMRPFFTLPRLVPAVGLAAAAAVTVIVVQRPDKPALDSETLYVAPARHSRPSAVRFVWSVSL